jgi:hypothetical protein
MSAYPLRRRVGEPRHTWTKDYRVPKHDVIGARAARDAPRGISREALEVSDETALAVGRLLREKVSSEQVEDISKKSHHLKRVEENVKDKLRNRMW